jgi:hypothetical protein
MEVRDIDCRKMFTRVLTDTGFEGVDWIQTALNITQ